MSFKTNLNDLIKENKDKTIEGLRDIYEKCDKCSKTLKHDAWINIKYSHFMIIGNCPSHISHAPGRHLYFVDSRYRKDIDPIFADVGLNVEDMYSTNVVKCAIPNNEAPTTEIQDACFAEYLSFELNIIKPKVIFLFGSVAAKFFDMSIGDSKDLEFDGFSSWLIALPHPSSFNYGKDSKERFISILNSNKNLIEGFITDYKFNHLHLHDCYSLRDSVIKIRDLVLRAKDQHKEYVCVTNHGNLSSVLQLESECRANNIRPIFGFEAYTMDNMHEFQEAIDDGEHKAKNELRKKKARHLVLLAKNNKGFHNIIKIHNEGWIKYFMYRPYCDFKTILANKSDMICMSACSSGFLSHELINGDYDKAKYYAELLKKEFGEDFYIELIMINFQEQINITDDLIKIAKELKVKTVITCDVHYLDEDDNIVRELMFNLYDRKKTIEDLKNSVAEKECTDLYYKTVGDVYDMFKEKYETDIFTEEVFFESIKTQQEIYEKITDYNIERLPDNTKFFEDEKKEIVKLTVESLREKVASGEIDKSRISEYKQRIGHELGVISRCGYVDYFLILSDMIRHCKKTYGKYSVGVGRGSAAGSMVNYLLDISGVDPIPTNLLFERFLSDDRKDLVDIDSDFSSDIRDNVIDYAGERFGHNHVMHIGTYSFLKTKVCIQDIGRFLGIDPKISFGITKKMGLDLDEELTYEQLREEFPGFKSVTNQYPEFEFYFKKMKGLVRHGSKHAAGFLIMSEDLYNTIPVIKVGDVICSGWQEGSDFHELSHLGYYKFDILGLNNLKIISDCLKEIDHEVNLDHVEEYNDKIIEFMKKDDYFGIFQFESPLARKVINQVKPENFEHFVHINSLLRPGPLRAGVVDIYAKRKNGEESYDLIPELEPILGSTFGLIVEQEQIMKVSQVLGGFSEFESNTFRKALVKYAKSAENEQNRFQQVLSYRTKFVENASNIVGLDEANKLFDFMASFAQYGFNRSHSLSYALTAYREMYLKTFYTLEFYVSLLNNTDIGVKDDHFDFRIKKYVISTFVKGFDIKIPHINEIDYKFQKKDGDILYGFANVKFVSEKVFADLLEKRPFADFADFYNRVNRRIVNKRVVESLVFCGCFDGFNSDKIAVLEEYKKLKKDKNLDYSNVNIAEMQKSFLNYDFFEMKDFYRDAREFIKSKREKFDANENVDIVRIDNFYKTKSGFMLSVYGLKNIIERIWIHDDNFAALDLLESRDMMINISTDKDFVRINKANQISLGGKDVV